jgi:hypothetical protein
MPSGMAQKSMIVFFKYNHLILKAGSFEYILTRETRNPIAPPQFLVFFDNAVRCAM